MIVVIVIEVINPFSAMIPVLGMFIELVLVAPLVLFEARFLCCVYDATRA